VGFPRFRAAPALFVGSAAALLFGVAAAGLFGADKPVTIFSDDTQMKSVTGKLVQIAVAAPPKQEVAPAKGKIETMPTNLDETPVFAPATPLMTPPAPRRAVVVSEPEEVEDGADAEPDYVRAQARWRQVDSYDTGYVEPAPYRTSRYERAPADTGYAARYDDAPRYEDRYAARDRRTTDRREYVERYAEPPPYRFAEPRYERGW
jgi:hypothetical protein